MKNKVSITALAAILMARFGIGKKKPEKKKEKPLFCIHGKIRSRQARLLFGK